MCSYNKEDGVYSCSNAERLQRDLKKGMAFQGFVQSDWGAGHGTTVEQGLDMDMPMSATPDFAPDKLEKVSQLLPPACTNQALHRAACVPLFDHVCLWLHFTICAMSTVRRALSFALGFDCLDLCICR